MRDLSIKIGETCVDCDLSHDALNTLGGRCIKDWNMKDQLCPGPDCPGPGSYRLNLTQNVWLYDLSTDVLRSRMRFFKLCDKPRELYNVYLTLARRKALKAEDVEKAVVSTRLVAALIQGVTGVYLGEAKTIKVLESNEVPMARRNSNPKGARQWDKSAVFDFINKLQNEVD